MRIISFGELYVDYYFLNGKFLGINGGSSSANMIANFSHDYNTAFIGVVGNDTQGKIALNSLKLLGVDTSNIIIKNRDTNKLFYNKNKISNMCPYCDRLVEINDDNIKELVLNNVKEDDIIVVDNIDDQTIDILSNLDNKSYLNFSYLGDDLYLSLEELENKLSGLFEIINIDEKVYNLIKRKYLIDSVDLYEMLKPKILIIDRNLRGADIIFDGVLYKKEVEEPINNETDEIGAQDAFFTEIIKYFLVDKEINEKSISCAYMKATSSSNYVRKQIGARSHLEPNYQISNYHECICREIEVNNID